MSLPPEKRTTFKKKDKRIALPHHVSESLNDMMAHYNKIPGFQICLLQMKWAEIVGADIAGLIEPTKWFKGILMVKSVSSSAKFTLSYQLPHVIDKINTHFGKNAVHTIRYERSNWTSTP
jgi:hypothetical protein